VGGLRTSASSSTAAFERMEEKVLVGGTSLLAPVSGWPQPDCSRSYWLAGHIVVRPSRGWQKAGRLSSACCSHCGLWTAAVTDCCRLVLTLAAWSGVQGYIDVADGSSSAAAADADPLHLWLLL
jgi:hypothetical protein